MPLTDYLVGFVFFAGTVGAAGAAGAVLVRRRLPHLAGAPRVLAVGLTGTAVLIAVHLLPGLVGILSRESALSCGALALAGALLVPAVEGPAETPLRPPPSGLLSWALAAPAAAAAGLFHLGAAWIGSGEPSIEIDTLTFHLPNVARWIDSGSFWQVDQFTPLLANGNYPHNGDVVFLAALLPWENDAFARPLGLPFAALAALAVYAIAVELGAVRATAVLAAAVFAALPALYLAAHDGAKTDPVMLASFGSGLLFLLRHFRTGRRSELVLAGAGFGIAFGTKWYGVSSVAVVVAVWAVASLVAGRPWRSLARDGAVVGTGIAALGGFWLVRNLVESGNPLFPVEVKVAGLTLFDAPRDFIRECGGFRIVDYLGSPGAWPDFILPAWGENYALGGPLLLTGAVLAVLAVLGAGRGAAAGGRVGALLVGAILLFVAYAVTPYSAFGPEGRPVLVGANARWLLPALLVAAALFAGAAGRLGRVRPLAEAAGLAAVVDGIRRGDVPLGLMAKGGLVVALLAGVAGALVLMHRRGGTRSPSRRAAMAAAAALVLVAGAALGHARQRTFNDARYAEGDPVIAWFAREAPADHRVGLAGVWSVSGLAPVLPAFGPRLGNDVAYVGRFHDGQLREWETRPEFAAAVARGGFDLLVVGKGSYSGCRVPGSGTDETAWAAAEGFRRLAESDRLVLYRVGAR